MMRTEFVWGVSYKYPKSRRVLLLGTYRTRADAMFKHSLAHDITWEECRKAHGAKAVRLRVVWDDKVTP